VTDTDPRAERDLDDRLRDLGQTNAPLPAPLRDAVKQRVLAAITDAPAIVDPPAPDARPAVEPDRSARSRRTRRWLLGGSVVGAAALAAVVFLAPCLEREPVNQHSRPDVGIGAPHGRTAAGGSVMRPPAPPPAPKSVAHTVAPQNVPPSALEAQRVAGDKMVMPDDGTKTAIAESGKEKVVGSWKLCVDEHGDIFSIHPLKSTGFPAYDVGIEIAMSQWRYQPQPVPVCTAVTFIYSQH
jgi:hypothetical protein